LAAALLDESPLVRVAAAEVCLTQGFVELRDQATDQLLAAADVNLNGHFVAVAALNVLDGHWKTLPESVREQVTQLPRSADSPPERVGKYVGRLLDYVKTQE